MMQCPSISDLNQLLTESLSAGERIGISQHVGECDVCQQVLDGLTVSDFDSSDDPPEGQDPAVAALVERLRNTQPRQANSLTTETDPTAPLSIDDFQLQDQIGRGGMGSVYRAIQTSLNKPVAIKLLEEVNAADAQLVARFLKEACAAASLRHPNIVDVHGIGRTPEGGYFLVMDLVEGCDLERLVVEGRRDDLDVVSIIVTIADAIQHAHDRGVVHRDLKPSNILISESGEVLVSDFGIAKFLTSQSSTWSQHGQPIGTPSYMSPEQADSRRGEVGPATDVYGLGGILYFLLTGRHPYVRGEGGDVAVIAQVLATDPPTPPSELNSDVPALIEAICLQCLQKTPCDRFQSVQEVADALTGRVEPKVKGQESKQATITEALPVEPPFGAVSLDSKFYLARPADSVYEAAVARRDSIVLVRGARQVGKTSLLARGLKQARGAGTRVVLTDLQKLNASDLATAGSLFMTLGDWIAERLDLDASPYDSWDSRRGASANFERFLRREVLAKLDAPLVWGLDEVDRLFTCDFSSEVFGLFRSWHNERALDPSGPWSQLTLAIAYATEAHLFITDINQSPFNVGTRISLDDFTLDQVTELNRRYGSPLKNEHEVTRFTNLVGGQPYLVHRSLYELSEQGLDLGDFIERAAGDDGVFGDHLRRIVVLLAQDKELAAALRGMMNGSTGLTMEQFYRLRSAGILAGESASECRLRCVLYEQYLEKRF